MGSKLIKLKSAPTPFSRLNQTRFALCGNFQNVGRHSSNSCIGAPIINIAWMCPRLIGLLALNRRNKVNWVTKHSRRIRIIKSIPFHFVQTGVYSKYYCATDTTS